jgi:putative tryptophan/tyrosine transport system substrate-binding protein
MWRTILGLLLPLVLGIAGMPPVPHAQPPGKVYRVGFLTVHDGFDPAFREAMRQLGYIEGQNLALEGRFAHGQAERLPTLAAELVQLGVDVLVTISTPAALAAKDATTRIPIVMASVSQPVERGLVVNLAQPGGNLTGQSNEPGTELGGKQLEILKEAVPTLSRVGVFWNATFQTPTLRAIEAAAQALGITVLPVDIQEPAHVEAAFATMLQERAEALVVTAAAQNVRHYQQIADFATTHRLPTMFQARGAVEAGGLMSYYLDWAAQRRRAAVYVDKILKGAKPADLPVEQPTKFEFVINLKTAKALGLTIPPTLLFQADEVIR